MLSDTERNDLLDAIDAARDVAHTSRDLQRAEDAQRVADWLTELHIRRQYRPLLCRVGLHRWVECEGRRVCARCAAVRVIEAV